MAEAKPERKFGKNFYAEAAKDPEVLAKRAARKAQLVAKVQHMVDSMPGRVPSWDRERIMQMDRFCLENGKRCIMWDDEGAGFYLMLNWDWLRNRPATLAAPEDEEEGEQGWWHNIRGILRLPLLDPGLSDETMAAWVDAHTMRVHGAFLPHLQQLRREGEGKGARLVLDHPYWQELQALPVWQPKPAPTPKPDPWAEALNPAPRPAAAATAAQGGA